MILYKDYLVYLDGVARAISALESKDRTELESFRLEVLRLQAGITFERYSAYKEHGYE